MMICHCLGVSDRAIRRAVADDARDLDSVAEACGAGAICGGCRPAVADVLMSCGVSVVAVSLQPGLRRSSVHADRRVHATSAA